MSRQVNRRKSFDAPVVAEYGAFAWFFHRYWNEDFHSAAFPVLERIWLPRIPPPARILDVCCGTGYLAQLLIGRGYRVTGIDASADMIAFARQTAPEGEFHLCDAASFTLPQCYDGAVSTFDSLNHILSEDALRSTLWNTAAALKPGSTFVFDMLTEEAYQTHWGEGFVIVRDDHVLTITGAAYDFRSRMAQCTITMFRLIDGSWKRDDVVVRERCYTPQELDSALSDAGFGSVNCYAAADLGMAGELGAGRTFYVAIRC